MMKTGEIIQLRGKHKWVLLFFVCACFYSCKEKYLPTIKDVNINYLVVEGLINTGADSTIFTLSRTFKLNNKPIEAPEKGAIVQVESEAGATYVLPALFNARRYGRPSLGLDPTKKYRLRIRTTDKREYLSDFVESKTSQPFSLKYDFKDDALNIYADTHDSLGKSRNYMYTYVELSAYDVPVKSFYKIENKQVVERNLIDDNINLCWHLTPSPSINLASTSNLTEDRIENKRIVLIPKTSEKISIEYTIFVKQTVVTNEGFAFYESLRKNTEDVGTIFDPQPSQLFSNIRSTNTSDDVIIGFISAGTASKQRMTVALAELPTAWFVGRETDEGCIKTVGALPLETIAQYITEGKEKQLGTPVDKRGVPTPPGWGYGFTKVLECVDCRAKGGTIKKPDF